MKKIKVTLVFLLCLLPLALGAQTKVTLSGTVLDGQTKEALVGVVVMEKNTNNAATTDLDGKFQIKVPAGVQYRHCAGSLYMSNIFFIYKYIIYFSKCVFVHIIYSSFFE